MLRSHQTASRRTLHLCMVILVCVQAKGGHGGHGGGHHTRARHRHGSSGDEDPEPLKVIAIFVLFATIIVWIEYCKHKRASSNYNKLLKATRQRVLSSSGDCISGTNDNNGSKATNDTNGNEEDSTDNNNDKNNDINNRHHPTNGLYKCKYTESRKALQSQVNLSFRLASAPSYLNNDDHDSNDETVSIINPQLWRISGHGEDDDGPFQITTGFAARNGDAYWVERTWDKRNVLIRGRFDFEMNELRQGQWLCENGVSGTLQQFQLEDCRAREIKPETFARSWLWPRHRRSSQRANME